MDSLIIEQRTISDILAGNASVFSRIIDRHQLKVRSYLSKRCGNNSDVDDITQEIFIAAYKNLGQYDTAKPFSAWLFGIARNKSNEHFRKVKRVPLPMAEEDMPEAVHTITPACEVTVAERSRHFWQESKRLLSKEQFNIIWLKYQSELSVVEISDRLNISESNVKIHLFRARKKLSTSNLINQLAS